MRAASGYARRLVLRPELRTVLACALLLLALDWAADAAGDSVVPGGPLDEGAHLLTTLLVLWALGPAITARFMVPALVASVAIDADHIPQHLGTRFLTVGTPRPYTHSLLTLAVVLVLAVAWRTRAGRRIWLGVALGLAIHFWRDLGESSAGVSLLWPFTDSAARLPHWSYLAVMAVVVAVVVLRVGGWRPGWDARHPSSQLPPA